VLTADGTGRSNIAFAGLVTLLWLLRTTPRRAVKLPRPASELLMIGSAILIGHSVWATAAVIGMLWWLRQTRRSAWWVVLFAWNPAVTPGSGTATAAAATAVLMPAAGMTALGISAGLSVPMLTLSAAADLLWWLRRAKQR
jgi:hypothetical protein